MKLRWVMPLIATAFMFSSALFAANPTEKAAPAVAKQNAATDQAERFKKFEKTLSGARLVGHFTSVDKDPAAPRKEEYTITSVTKMDEGDFWLFRTRIKYGEHDVSAPLALEVKWAGDTPVITLDELTIPNLGTFSARVVIYNDQYAGMWTHGKAGGQLFGTIERAEAK